MSNNLLIFHVDCCNKRHLRELVKFLHSLLLTKVIALLSIRVNYKNASCAVPAT